MDEWGLGNDFTEMVAYFCAEAKITGATVSGKVTAINVYYEQWREAVTAAEAIYDRGRGKKYSTERLRKGITMRG